MNAEISPLAPNWPPKTQSLSPSPTIRSSSLSLQKAYTIVHKMGFLTSLIAGATLTISALYIPLLHHQRTRHSQALILRSQTQLLNSLVEPSTVIRMHIEEERLNRGWAEGWKEGWNENVRDVVRWVQNVNWGNVREVESGR